MFLGCSVWFKMVKKNNNKNNKENLIIALLLLLVFLVGTGRISIGANGGANGTIPVVNNPDYVPVSPSEDCYDYDIADEFRNAFGDVSINNWRTGCTGIGGEWRERDDELGCWWDPDAAVPIDCDSSNVRVLEFFCEQHLYADWFCDNDIAYAGCICDDDPPANWDADHDEEYDYPCDWYDTLTGMECRGYCPAPDTSCTVMPGTDWCDCFSAEDLQEGSALKLRVFVTSASWTGPMGGINGADEKCQHAAYYAGLGPNWEAIISDTRVSAVDRISDGAYVRLDGVRIASSKAELFTAPLDAPLNVNELGEPENAYVWSGTFGNGLTTGNCCHDWGWIGEVGTRGHSQRTDDGWLIVDRHANCSLGGHLYCVEVYQ